MSPIKRLRLARGYSQSQLADRIGRSPSFVSHVEQGDYQPGRDTLMALSRVLGVTVDELLTTSEPPVSSQPWAVSSG